MNDNIEYNKFSKFNEKTQKREINYMIMKVKGDGKNTTH